MEYCFAGKWFVFITVLHCTLLCSIYSVPRVAVAWGQHQRASKALLHVICWKYLIFQIIFFCGFVFAVPRVFLDYSRAKKIFTSVHEGELIT